MEHSRACAERALSGLRGKSILGLARESFLGCAERAFSGFLGKANAREGENILGLARVREGGEHYRACAREGIISIIN